MKIVVGMMFKNMLDGIQFYRVYAVRCGFDIRFSTVRKSKDGTITWKYILCNRAGEKNAAVDFDATVDGVIDKRHKVSRRVRCRARVVLKFSGLDVYAFHFFEERHSHPLVSDKHKEFLKRMELCSAFYFEYLVDGKYQLRHIFWADPICRRNFATFGDSVSFDATYNTNRYKMVFTPFTGKDNHGKCVTFGAALMSSENTSISESANSFYGSFVNSNCNLVEFFMKYDSVIDAQRHAYAEMNSVDESTVPSLQTPILFEKHVVAVYTTNIFVKVQKEIYSACVKCRIMSITESEHQLFYNVNDAEGIFQVVYDSVEDIIVCSCAKFVREGLLCCHIYILLKDLNVDRIPDKYVVPRWTRYQSADNEDVQITSFINNISFR
ncbi:hypothetical protein C2S52_013446 [Perilla frutescens var. hirtella]|nr:hypothetical protein C2S52_013446 [Perilla frutescens var. hirtella]